MNAAADKDTAEKKATAKTAKAAKAEKPAKARKAPKAESTANAAAKPRFDEGRLAQVLVEPIISEKATLVSEKRNQVTFKVLRQATKPEIKAAVELLFKVEVASVQTVVQKGKVKKFGRSIGRRDHVKKAYVTLKPGHELNFSGEGA